jgi:diaminohydroxyphosphoribosylaminopyrimidine deaminase/5-amino-6-(5-phosphoribosylamino)uracil reductase
MSPEDYGFMGMAYGLAAKAIGRASPNPLVGAVIVRRGVIVGTGFHDGPGKPHAEIVALRRAGRRAEGATVYITLEPCVHWGRTPPCVDALLQARPKRVVVSDLDPNPLVYRKGVGRLRRGGVRVESGLLAERNRRLNEAYIKYITRRVPFVTLKAAVSLDGRMATRTHESRWISSPAAREYVHLLRAEADAVMVGINTVLRDDPRLTVRHPQWKDKTLVRAIMDSRLRLPLDARILGTLDRGPIVVFCGAEAPRKKAEALEQRGVRVVRLPARGGALDLGRALAWLGRNEVAGLLVEGGSALASSILENRLADKLVLTLSPRLIGGAGSPAFVAGEGCSRLSEALPLKGLRVFSVGPDIVAEGYL